MRSDTRHDLNFLGSRTFGEGDACFGGAALVVGAVAKFCGSAAGFGERES